MNITKLLKKIGQWTLAIFFAISALVFFPSLASLFSVLIVVLAFPLQKWQNCLSRYLKTGVKVVLIVILFALVISTTPKTTPIDENSVLSSGTFESIPPTGTTGTSAPVSSPGNSHTHQFAAATCTSPKKCTICGDTEGTALGHVWNTATCTSAKTCSACGTTVGSAAGHSWKKATCTVPKTCSVCAITEGKAAGHTYSNGKCITCGAKDPNYTSETMVWIPTNGGKKYHKTSTCSQMEDPEHVTKSEAESRGFTPCKRCYG